MMMVWLTGVGDAVEVALSAALVASGGRRAVATVLAHDDNADSLYRL